MFKLTTVADKIGPAADPLSLDIFQKICDPLLSVHNNYHQLPKRAYVNGKKSKANSRLLNNSSMVESTVADQN
jgi:hypothetical protein